MRWNACFAARLLVASDSEREAGGAGRRGWSAGLAESLEAAALGGDNLKLRIQARRARVRVSVRVCA